ncbi:hypothetical protein [Rhizobium lentis]|uniref:Uncharacterized protein n=1 Tax=Rhizobium lentis TaxID=1138194 RepID=A0A9Q3QVM7_9HYPH|nr:hypothetical protein [Rhizobium lentis]MBX5012542.1 hypothetical protein [Rhizobium lentis]MBX5024141.1 hypothetical protein [Rhizobium lentis]
MKEQDLKELGEAVLKETRTDITPKQLIKAVMKSHPQASKKGDRPGGLLCAYCACRQRA